jgi:hypothetical protein
MEARDRIAEQGREFGNALGIDPNNVEPVQLDDRGNEFGFVPTDSGREELRTDFAEDRPFVEPADTLVDASPTEGVETRTDPDRRGSIGQDALADVAADDPFATPSDFDVEVGPGGVEEVEITDQGARRRASREFESETGLSEVDPQQGIQETDSGFRLGENPRRRLTADSFESQTQLSQVDPQADLTRADDGFALDEAAQRRNAARNFESDIGLFGAGEIEPASLRDTDSGFGLGRDRSRQVAADNIDEQVDEFDVGPDDISLERNDSGEFVGEFSREVSR